VGLAAAPPKIATDLVAELCWRALRTRYPGPSPYVGPKLGRTCVIGKPHPASWSTIATIVANCRITLCRTEDTHPWFKLGPDQPLVAPSLPRSKQPMTSELVHPVTSVSVVAWRDVAALIRRNMAAVPRDFHSPDAACAEVPARPYSSRHWRQRSTFSVTAVVARLLCLVRLRRDVASAAACPPAGDSGGTARRRAGSDHALQAV
jgi:hypothetical protein